MNLEEYERMYRLEGSYWWFQGRLSIIKSVLAAHLPFPPRAGRVLDVGCGTGLMLEEFSRWNPTGLDFSPAALAFCRRRGLAALSQGDVTRLPFASESIDLILALDVMEHVEDHQAMVREFNRVLRPGGCLMATVPAHPSLWSDHDVALHHFRRYTRASLKELLAEGGLRPRKFSYAVSFTFLPIVAFRMVERLLRGKPEPQGTPTTRREARAHLVHFPRPLNALLTSVLALEGWLLRSINLPVGVSLITLAEKVRSVESPAP